MGRAQNTEYIYPTLHCYFLVILHSFLLSISQTSNAGSFQIVTSKTTLLEHGLQRVFQQQRLARVCYASNQTLATIHWGEIRRFPFTQAPRGIRYFLVCRLKHSRWVWVRWTADRRQEATWRPLSVPLVLTGIVTLQAGVVLTLAPGTALAMGPNAQFQVDGTLRAVAAAPIMQQ